MREQIIALLQKYLPAGLRPGASGNVLTKCPFHKGGQERKPSFSVNVETGVFHCFTCHEAGDIRLLMRMLGIPRSTIDFELKSIQPLLDENRKRIQFDKENFFSSNDPFRAQWVLPESLLGIYEWCPTSLVEKGFDVALMQSMEVGYDNQQQRITYPLRDMYGQLAGISGGATLGTQQPKYLVYQGGYRDTFRRWIPGNFGQWFDEMFPGYKCENHHYLWNFHRVYPRVVAAVSDQDSTVILVEGFKACLWTIQSGFANTAALMGSYISDIQQRMLHRLGGTVILMFDNDQAGRDATARVGKLLWKPLYGHIKIARYPDEDILASRHGVDGGDSQPDDYEPAGVQWMIQNAVSYPEWMTLYGRT